MLEPRQIRPESIPTALKQAQHYRLLNEPALAESICRDILAVAPENEEALITLLLSLTDQFDIRQGSAYDQANQIVHQVSTEYKRQYYAGIVNERWARAQLRVGLPMDAVESWVRKAMNSFLLASELAPADDPNPILRWNSCVRLLNQFDLQSPEGKAAVASFQRDLESEYGDDVPLL